MGKRRTTHNGVGYSRKLELETRSTITEKDQKLRKTDAVVNKCSAKKRYPQVQYNLPYTPNVKSVLNEKVGKFPDLLHLYLNLVTHCQLHLSSSYRDNFADWLKILKINHCLGGGQKIIAFKSSLGLYFFALIVRFLYGSISKKRFTLILEVVLLRGKREGGRVDD